MLHYNRIPPNDRFNNDVETLSFLFVSFPLTPYLSSLYP